MKEARQSTRCVIALVSSSESGRTLGWWGGAGGAAPLGGAWGAFENILCCELGDGDWVYIY